MASILRDVRMIDKADTGYAEEERYWSDEVGEIFSNPRTARLLGGAAKNYPVNLCVPAVRAVATRMELQGLRITAPDGRRDKTAAEEFDTRVDRPSKLGQQIEDAISYALRYGDGYLIADPQLPEDGEHLPVYARGPIGTRAFYADENPSQLERLVLRWSVPPPDRPDEEDRRLWRLRVNVLELDGITRYLSRVPAGDVKSDADFEPYDPDVDPDAPGDVADDGLPPIQDGGGEHRPGFIPNASYDPVTGTGSWYAVHLRTGRPYGTSEHHLVHGAQNLLVKAVVTLAESLDGFALPYRYEIRKSNTALGSGGDVFPGEGSGDRPEDEDQPTGQAGELGVHWDADSVGQLTPAEVSNLLEPIELCMRLAASVSGTPLDFFDASAASASGDSKREHREALNARAGKRRDDFGREIGDLAEFLLGLLGYPDHTVKVVWKPMETTPAVDQFKAVDEGVKAGLPWPYVLSTVLDLDPSEIDADEWPDPRESRQAAAELLKTVAQALQAMGAAVTLGTVSSDTVLELVSRSIGDVGTGTGEV